MIEAFTEIGIKNKIEEAAYIVQQEPDAGWCFFTLIFHFD